MKILVTGGAGFIGSHLVEALIKRDDEITVIDDLSSGYRSNIAGIPSCANFHFNCFDIRNYQITEKYDIIYHLAALPWSKKVDWKTKIKYFDVNVKSLLNLLDINGLFVFMSSAGVYGEGRKLKETSPLNPQSFYAFTKAVAEEMVRLNRKNYIIFRPGTVIGTRGRCFPNRLVWCAVNKIYIEIFNLGNCTRDLIDVNDVISVLVNIKKIPYGTYNLGSNREFYSSDIVEAVNNISVKRLGHGLKYSYIEHKPEGYPEDSTLKTILSGSGLWKPKYKLHETLETLFDYYEKGGHEPPSWENI